MFRITKSAVVAIALTSLVIAQPAMAVRSSESLPAPGAKVSGMAGRVGSPIRKSDELVGVPFVAIAIAGAVILATILIVASDNKKKNESPG